jgi:hypothetical protein
LENLPAFDAGSRTIRLTTRLEVTKDSSGNPVGFLGRAHPLVRKALDRVRNLSYGETGGLDCRVSAVATNDLEPRLLCTFLGRVMSGAGREFERVIAVESPKEGLPHFIPEASEWLAKADSNKALRTGGLWERHFQSWADGISSKAREVAHEGFAPLAKAYCEGRGHDLKRERQELDQWLAQRVHEITDGPETQPKPAGLFDQEDRVDLTSPPTWASITDPMARLGGFQADRSQHPTRRSEAEGVLRLYRQRLQDLTGRETLHPPEVLPLGILMLIPEGSRVP